MLMAATLTCFAVGVWLFSQHLLSRINEQWAAQLAERQVQFDKHRTLMPLTREIALARQMAAEPALIEMALDERNPQVKRRAIEVLERYRLNFRDHSYFAAFARTGSYYFNDAANQFASRQLRYTLSKSNPDDQWFFATLSSGKDYQVNLDPDVNLGVTKVWINVLIKRGADVLGVIGTGIDITEFLKATVDISQPGIHNLFVDRDMAIQLYRDASLIDYNSIVKDVRQRSKVDALFKDTADVENLRQVIKRLEASGEKIATLWVHFEGAKHLLGVAYLPELGWFDLTLMNTKKLSLFGDMALVPLSFGLFFLFALLAVGAVVHYWVLGPITRLQNSMSEIQQGNYDTNLPLVGSGEILQLSRKFRGMVEFVRDANSALENRVAERTRELDERNIKLAKSLSLQQATLDSSHDAVLVVDLNGKWVLHNQRFVDMWHITDEILNTADDAAALSFVLNQLEGAGGFLNKVHELYASPETGSFDMIKFKDGRIIERYSIPQRIEGGVVGRVWSFRDVTEQRQREAELAANRELLHNIEQSQLITQERQRLMQDMHDGLGSSLIIALREVEHGRMNGTETAGVLKGCIDDLKLAIDSTEAVEADLLLLLATLRFRMEPRLENTGIRLRWEIADVPPLNWLNPGSALHILRILQEAFANAIKHARATEIRIATRVTSDSVLVTITDNGKGFAAEFALKSRGKGLHNQIRRAESIGAEVSWDSTGAGTCFTLCLPIELAS